MMEIKAIKGNQAGGVFYSGMMNVKDIVNEEICVVKRLKPEDYADASPQRPLDNTAVKRIAKDIIKANDSKTGKTGGLATPTAILLSCDQNLEYDEQRQILSLPDGVVLSIMDGQHRVEGWKLALAKGLENESLKNSTIAVTIIPAISSGNKIWQFWSCNYLAKKPTQDQSLNLLAHAWKVNIDGAFIPVAAEKRVETREDVFNVVDFVYRMNKCDSSVWKNHILLEGEKEGSSNKTRLRAMVDVLRKEVFTEDSLNTAEYLWNSYWRVLKGLLQGTYSDSALFKSTGCELFNTVYNQFINACKDEYGRDNLTESNMTELWLAIFGELDEDYTFITNPDFWQPGSDINGKKLKDYASREPRKDLIHRIKVAIKACANKQQPID